MTTSAASGTEDTAIALSIVLTLGATWILFRAAAKIFRIGILMYGKRPTLREVFTRYRKTHNDGVFDGTDSASLNPDQCRDADGDTCDDCGSLQPMLNGSPSSVRYANVLSFTARSR